MCLKERDVLNLGAGGVVAKAANRFFTGHGVLFQSPCGLGVGSVLSGCRHLNFQTILVIVVSTDTRTDDSDHNGDSNPCPHFLTFHSHSREIRFIELNHSDTLIFQASSLPASTREQFQHCERTSILSLFEPISQAETAIKPHTRDSLNISRLILRFKKSL